jgi:hypothetical protein
MSDGVQDGESVRMANAVAARIRPYVDTWQAGRFRVHVHVTEAELVAILTCLGYDPDWTPPWVATMYGFPCVVRDR